LYYPFTREFSSGRVESAKYTNKILILIISKD
jgi:hypothetical protein